MEITRREWVRLAAGVPAISACAAAASKEFWDTKPATEWTAQEIDRMITKSPWAKEVSGAFNGAPGGFGGGGGGTGRSRGGIGFPGGGIGYPRSGGGQPGGIGLPPGPFPGGGGGRRDGPDGTDRRRSFSGTVRWDSALPIQEALHSGLSDEKPNADFAKYYVIALIGDLPMLGGRRRGSSDDDSDDDSAQSERRIEMFKQYTRLERKDNPIQLEKVEEGSRVGNRGPGTYFYFSRLDDISMDDKQVTFSTKLGPMEVRAKFTLKEMLYRGKLAL